MATALSLASLLVSASLSLGEPAVPPSEWANEAKYNRFIKDWLRRLQELEEMLHSPDAKTAKKVERLSSHLYREMLDRVVEGEGASELFGRVLFLQAVAETRLGDLDTAAWRWQEVQSLRPDAKESLTSSYPDVADRLKSWFVNADRWGKAPWIGKFKPSATDGQAATGSGSGAFVPPKLVKTILPHYSKALVYLRRDGEVVVEFVVGKTGVPRGPLLKASSGLAALDVTAMEVLKDWRFEPAAAGGKPTSVIFTEHFSFTARH